MPDIAWAADLEADAPRMKPGGTMASLDTPRPDLLAYEVDGRMTRDAMAPAIASLNEAFAAHDKIDIFLRIKTFGGFDLSLLADADLRRMKMRGLTHVRRYAVVGAPDWMERLVGMAGTVMPLSIRMFDADEEDRAWAWLSRAA